MRPPSSQVRGVASMNNPAGHVAGFAGKRKPPIGGRRTSLGSHEMGGDRLVSHEVSDSDNSTPDHSNHGHAFGSDDPKEKFRRGSLHEVSDKNKKRGSKEQKRKK